MTGAGISIKNDHNFLISIKMSLDFLPPEGNHLCNHSIYDLED